MFIYPRGLKPGIYPAERAICTAYSPLIGLYVLHIALKKLSGPQIFETRFLIFFFDFFFKNFFLDFFQKKIFIFFCDFFFRFFFRNFFVEKILDFRENQKIEKKKIGGIGIFLEKNYISKKNIYRLYHIFSFYIQQYSPSKENFLSSACGLGQKIFLLGAILLDIALENMI